MNKNDIHQIRAFNRFYTRVIGLLDKYLLDSHYTLPEVRVMYEIYHNKKITSKEITELSGMDKSYLSRMLHGFEKKGLIDRKSSKEDGRVQIVSLTGKGKNEYLQVDQATEYQISELLSKLTKQEIQALILHMEQIQNLFSKINKKK